MALRCWLFWGAALAHVRGSASFHSTDLILPLQANLGYCTHPNVSKGSSGVTWSPLRETQSQHMLGSRWAVLSPYETRFSKSLAFKLFFFHLVLKYPFLKQWFWCWSLKSFGIWVKRHCLQTEEGKIWCDKMAVTRIMRDKEKHSLDAEKLPTTLIQSKDIKCEEQMK